ncbi:MAG: hypothetical protein JNL69_01825 [Bacteroidia bacterium]|nr:hypothetical protein [Bacteroidia bacterium]
MFTHVDPASNIPKGVLGLRIVNEGFNEVNEFKTSQSYRFLFGITSKLMITPSFNFSNHHGSKFPSDFIANDGNIGYHTHGVKKGNKYPYRFDNFNLNIKYRFLSIDGTQNHFRMAGYIEMAGGKEAHDEAEPNLMGDNGGFAGGITATKLNKRFAISLSVGGILPQAYSYQRKDSTLEVQYGKAINYSLSMGYLCFPFKYKSYKQVNINIYSEFIGKAYEGANIYSNSRKILIDNVPALEKGFYVEYRPSIQFIFNSNLRVDFSYATPIINRSYTHSYPLYFFTIQRYFYFK